MQLTIIFSITIFFTIVFFIMLFRSRKKIIPNFKEAKQKANLTAYEKDQIAKGNILHHFGTKSLYAKTREAARAELRKQTYEGKLAAKRTKKAIK